jgi:DNA mismatch repair protein MLH3
MSCIDAPIRPLAPDVAAKIKSSISITHLNGVVVDLVKNALDAESVSINVIVDYRRGGCVVDDDGQGIPAAEFEDGSGLGQAHSESGKSVSALC